MAKRRIKTELINILKAAILPVLFLVLWEWAAQNGHIQISIVSTPSKIRDSFIDLFIKGKYQLYFWVSTIRFFKGFILGTILGLLFGIMMGLSKKANAYFVAIVGLLRSIPLVAWVPIAILSLGVGETTKDILVAIGCFWSVFLNTADGIKGVNQKYIEVATILEKGKVVQILKVIIPAAFPNIVTGLREGFSNSWRSIVAAEMIGASSGIGYIITYGREISRPDLMYVGLTTIAIVGLVLELILLQIQKVALSSYAR